MNEEFKHEDDPAMELPEIPANQPDFTEPVAVAAEPVEPEPIPKARRNGWMIFAAAIALVAVGAAVGSATTFAIAKSALNRNPIGYIDASKLPAAKLVSVPPIQTGNVIPTVYRTASPGVVKIQASSARSRGASLGSGFVVDARGYIMTNHHVVDGATRILVGFIDETTMAATLVSSDKYTDIALLKVDVGNRSLIPLPLGDSSAVQVGELAIAIGSPFGNHYTVTAGIVSGLNREIREENNPFPIPGAIQTDAAINPGNSGGPLLNANGEVIGINTAIESEVQGSMGIGFAVPINTAKEILPTLIAGKRVDRPWLGVGLKDLSPEVAQLLGTDVTSGVFIAPVYENSPAAAVGLKASVFNRRGELVSVGDVIIEIDGTPIATSSGLIKYLSGRKTGDTIELKVARGKERLVLRATLGSRPDTLSDNE